MYEVIISEDGKELSRLQSESGVIVAVEPSNVLDIGETDKLWETLSQLMPDRLKT